MSGFMGLFFKNNHILYQKEGGSGAQGGAPKKPIPLTPKEAKEVDDIIADLMGNTSTQTKQTYATSQLPPPLAKDARTPEEEAKHNVKFAREHFNKYPTKENYLKLNNAISNNNKFRIEKLEKKIKNVSSEKDLATALKKGMSYSEKINRLKEQNKKIDSIEESLKTCIPQQRVTEKPKSFVEKLKGQVASAMKGNGPSK